MASPDPEKSKQSTILLDLCCGAGTIGISLSDSFKKVIGIEVVPEATEDAKFNTSLNNISDAKCRWICGKLENVINDVISELAPSDDLVVILDPPRSGVHGDVVRSIRGIDRLKRLVFVSCVPSKRLVILSL